MSSDRFESDGDRPLDGDLATHLLAFGDTLVDHVDQPIRPSGDAISNAVTAAADGLAVEVDAADDELDVDSVAVPLTMEVSRTNRAVWLAAAALVLVAAGFGLGRLWPTSEPSTDATESGPDAEGDTEIEDDAGPTDGLDPDEQGQPTTPTPAPDAPSTITAADGTTLATIDDEAALIDSPDLVIDDDGDPLARLVLGELHRLEVFGPATTREEVADRLVADGLTITTAYDPAAAALARDAINDLHPEGDRPDEVAVLTVDNRTGAIVALASSEPTAVLVDGVRQPGSTFKPFVLATLFEQGFQPDDLVDANGPCTFELPDALGGGPYTVGGSERGVESLRAAMLASNNCAYVRLGIVAGLDQVVDTAQDLGITTLPSEAGEFFSLPLGVTEVHGVELVGAYASFVTGGVHRTPWLVTEVLDRDGEVLFRRDQDTEPARQVLSPETAALMTSVLEDNVTSGTGVRAQLGGGHRAAGKTGTTNEATDAWFVGSTARYTTAVWVGDPDQFGLPAPIQIPGWSSFGGALPAAVWGRYNDELHVGLEPEPFAEPPAPQDREPITLVADHEVPAE